MQEQVERVKASRQDGVTVVELMDKKILDETSIAQISGQVSALVAEEGNPRFVLDFANVTHMSSSALGMLITLQKRIRQKGGRLVLCNIMASIYEVFVITRLNEVLRTCANRQEAVREASSQRAG